MNSTERLVRELESIRDEYRNTPLVSKLATDILSRELHLMAEVISPTHHVLLETFVVSFLERDLVGVRTMGDMIELLSEINVDGVDYVRLTMIKCHRLIQLVLETGVWKKLELTHSSIL